MRRKFVAISYTVMDKETIELISRCCIENLELKSAQLGNEYFYALMPLCVVDSVFSIGVNYKGVINTIKRLCDYFELEEYRNEAEIPSIEGQVSTTQFLQLVEDKTPDFLASQIYKNRQRTSTSNGILKVEAVNRFLLVLKQFKTEYFQDIPALINNIDFEKSIKEIPGQKSGISLKYFFMLAGSDDLIKPDRMIMRFLENITKQKVSLKDSQTILMNVSEELNKRGYSIAPRLLDNIIWNYQRIL